MVCILLMVVMLIWMNWVQASVSNYIYDYNY